MPKAATKRGGKVEKTKRGKKGKLRAARNTHNSTRDEPPHNAHKLVQLTTST